MSRFDQHRWLPGSVVSATLFTAAIVVFAQGAPTESTDPHPPLQASATPQAQATPEQLADSLMAHRRYQAAIEAYKQIHHPSATIWNKMGIAYQMMFNLPEATRCYEASLRLDPKNPNTLNNLGTIYDSQKDYKAAVKMYHKSLKLDPKSALVLKNLGTDLLAQHKYDAGWKAYQAALAVDPQVFDRNGGPRVENPASVQERGAMNYYMARGCMRAGQDECAIQYLRMALDEGYISPKKIAADQEFAGLHGQPAFDRLISEQEKQ